MRGEDFVKLGTSSRLGILAASIVIVAVALYNWIVAPHVTYLRAVQKYEPVVEQVAQQKASLRELLSNRRKMLEDLESQFGQVRPLLYTDEQSRQLFGDLETLALEQKCTMTTAVDLSSNRSTTIAGEGQESLLVEGVNTRVTITGEYDGIAAFVGRLQARQHKIWIRALTIEPTGPDASVLQCRLDLNIYVIKEKEAVSHG